MSATARRLSSITAALVIGAVGLTACSGNDSAGDKASSAGSKASSAAGSGASKASSAVKNTDAPRGSVDKVPSMGKDVAGIRKDVTVDSCGLKTGAQTAKGKVKNSDKSARDLLIAVQWLPANSGDPLSVGVFTAKNVAPGKQMDWSAKGTLKAEAGRCVLLAQSAPAGTIK
ncbi:MAG: hypothetical protein LWW86_13940 [Micrococcales bacterium]|nr:hypothetical protein [Micrococcales bacterium]